MRSIITSGNLTRHTPLDRGDLEDGI